MEFVSLSLGGICVKLTAVGFLGVEPVVPESSKQNRR